MQASTSPQQVTWITFAIEAVKILGPACLALAGSWIALRYQRLVKEREIDAQLSLKARELMFESYENKLNAEIAELKDLSKTLSGLKLKALTGSINEEAMLDLLSKLGGAPMSLFTSFEAIESDLKRFGLLETYEAEFRFLQEYDPDPSSFDFSNPSVLASSIDNVVKVTRHFTMITQALIEKKREQLFSDYLPKN